METLDFGLHDILIYEMKNGGGKGGKYLEKKSEEGNILHLYFILHIGNILHNLLILDILHILHILHILKI